MTRSVFRGYNRFKFQSMKLGTTVFCQSLLLRDYLLRIEWDENVQSYELKPFKISIKINGDRKTIQPHLRLNYTNQKPTIAWLKSAIDEKNLRKIIKLLKNFLESKDFNLSVVNADEVRKEPFFSNLKFLRRYIRSEITFIDSLLCLEFFNSVSEPVLGDLIQFFYRKNQNIQIAYALLTQKLIEADIQTIPINYGLPIKLRVQFPNFINGRLAI